MLVDLDKIKDIIRKPRVFINVDNLIQQIIYDIHLLQYGKIYQCLNCNKDIYFDKTYNIYRHIASDMIYITRNSNVICDGNLGSNVANQIAIPKPEDSLIESNKDNNHALHGSCPRIDLTQYE